jgi:hypothetical protein
MLQGPRHAPRFEASVVAAIHAASSTVACSGGESAGPSSSTESADAAPSAHAVAERIDRIFSEDPPFGTLNRDLIRRMMEVETDGPFFMANFIEHRARAEYPDGRGTDLTGREADALYGQQILPILLDIGARPVFVADVEITLQSTDAAEWDQVGVVLYPSRAAFFDMLEREDYRGIAVHKAAGVARTLVMPSQRTGVEFPDEFYMVDLAAVPYPPTDTDTPLAIVHLYDYRDLAVYADGRETDLTGEEAVNVYSQNRADQGVLELGVRPSLWLRPEGAIISDGREFDEFRINLFPSHATFAEVAGTYGEAGAEHREAGLENVYSLMTLPLINEYGYR